MARRGISPHEKAEQDLTAFGAALPEASAGAGWVPTRALYFRKKMFAVFGERGEKPGEFTMIVKLPVSAEMVQGLPFVRESKGWFKQHNWVIAHFGADDDVLAEIETLKAWLVQSYCAVAPKKLAAQVMAEHAR